LLRAPWSGAEFGLLLALLSLLMVHRVSAAAPATPEGVPALSLTAPPGGLVGPGSGLEMIWTITNRSDVARNVTLEITSSRSWPRARTVTGLAVPPNDSKGFVVPFSLPDTAAAGQVSVFARVHLDADATPLDSCASVLSVLNAPQAAVPVEIAADLVRLEWSGWLRWRDTGIVEVSRDDQGWYPDGSITADEQGRCAFEDHSVEPGGTVAYRLRATVAGLTMVSAVTTVHVPTLTPLAIAGLRPNPSLGMPVVAFTLPERAATRVEVYDVAGRRVYESDLGVLAPGPHLQTLEPDGALRSGVYVFRLTSGGRSVSVRGVIAR